MRKNGMDIEDIAKFINMDISKVRNIILSDYSKKLLFSASSLFITNLHQTGWIVSDAKRPNIKKYYSTIV